MRRHADELESLERYHKEHPNHHDPTSLRCWKLGKDPETDSADLRTDEVSFDSGTLGTTDSTGG